MPNKLIRVVFDCNIFWQIFFSSKGFSAQCWEQVVSGDAELFVSPAVLDEIGDVLTRPETQARFSKATEENVSLFIEEIIENSIFFSSIPNHFSYARDPKDEPYLNLAIEAEADYIVSRDKDLLDLMTGYDAESKTFRKRFRRIKIVDPQMFMGILEAN